jgi:PPP family 3-phenylpropionic acid transporter
MDLGRFRLAYFTYFLYLGTAGPYLSKYLEEHDIPRGVIGGLAATRIWVATFAAYFICRFADSRGIRLKTQRGLVAAAILVMGGWTLTDSTPALFLVAVAVGLMLGPQIPMLDSSTLDALDGNRNRFGSVRYVGTVGWGIAAFVAPFLFGSMAHDRALVWVLVLCLISYLFITLQLRDNQWRSQHVRPRLPVREVLRHSALRSLLLAGFLHSVAFGNYEEFSALHFQAAGASELETSIILIIGIATEVLVFLLVPRFLSDRNAITMGLIAITVAGTRWMVMPEIKSVGALMLLQISHGITFGLWYTAATQIVGAAVPREVRTSGQALVAISITAGMGTGALFGGILQGSVGTANAFRIAASVSALSACVLLWSFKRLRNLKPLQFNAATGQVSQQNLTY